MQPAPAFAVPLVWLALALATLAFALPRIDDLGLYYDEAFLAQQARDFVEPERAGVHPPSVQSRLIAGRPFPIRNAAYLGSLKSQLLIPSLALFGSSPFVLRTTTLVTGLLGLLFCMLFVERLLGASVAIASGLLVASDPSFYFFSQFEWGPFTSMLLCRGAGLYFLCRVFAPGEPGSRWLALTLGAACLGLGVYSRVDFAVILAALAASVLVCRRDLVVAAWRDQRLALLAGGALFALTVSPVIAVVGDVLSAGASIADRGGVAYRMDVLASVLDGSHFYRLIAAGGLFDQLFEGDAPATAFIALACVGAMVLMALPHTRDARAGSARFLLLTALLIPAAMLAVPGAVRAHHMLNAMPFPHFVAAAAGVGLWRRSWANERIGSSARACVALALAAALASNATTLLATRELIRETGGVGRWSRTLQEFIAEVDRAPGAAATEIVSLDWGFHEPALFTARHLKLREPIWAMAASGGRRARYSAAGDPHTIYLFHEQPYDLFGFGEPFARALRTSDPERYEVREHRDRTGELVFKSVRFDRAHELSFDGTFRVRLSAAAAPQPAAAAAP